MTDQNFTMNFSVPQSPAEAFAAISNVRGWWTGDIEGSADRLGAEFTYRYQDMHRSVQKVTEFVPGEKIVWHVTDGQINFVKDKTEWTGTDIVFDISGTGDATEIRFTHRGLTPESECFEDCSGGWTFYLGALQNFIQSGQMAA